MNVLDLLQETLTIRDAIRASVALAYFFVRGGEGAASALGRREDGAGGILKVKIGEEDRSTFVSLLSGIRDKLSN